MNNNWDLERKPTTVEKAVAVICSLLLLVVGSVSFWFSVSFIKNIWLSFLTIGFTLFAAFLAYHFAFTRGQKPNKRQLKITASVIVATSVGLVILGLIAQDYPNSFYLISTGMIGISGGTHLLMKARK